jgi:hypothetical protein
MEEEKEERRRLGQRVERFVSFDLVVQIQDTPDLLRGKKEAV